MWLRANCVLWQCLISYEVRNEATEAAFFKELGERLDVRRLEERELNPRYYCDEIHVYSVTRSSNI